jgi:acyl-CoA synthetase (AMP-forming)/AMP-acid ligase II
VKITDRTKNLVKSGGEWISSVDIENALMGHPAVVEAAVIAAKHPKWDERPVAVVVVKEDAAVTAGELRAFLEPKFAKFCPDALLANSWPCAPPGWSAAWSAGCRPRDAALTLGITQHVGNILKLLAADRLNSRHSRSDAIERAAEPRFMLLCC